MKPKTIIGKRTYEGMILAAGLIAALSVLKVSYAGESSKDGAAALKQNLGMLYPNTKFQSIQPSVYPGIYEVTMGKNVVYTDVNGRYFMFGHLFDMHEQKDLTEAKLAEMNKISFDSLPKDAAIVFKEGKGTRQLAVFSDPDCPYCRRLEPQLAKLKDVTIYLYMLPLSIHPDAAAQAEAVWCSQDRASSWRALLLEDKKAADSKCNTPIQQVASLARQLNISGTPTLVSGDGRVKPGAMDAQTIDNWLNGGGKK
ncbi:MAG: DsbC family protein [Sulfuricaulis sp.]